MCLAELRAEEEEHVWDCPTAADGGDDSLCCAVAPKQPIGGKRRESSFPLM
jgi:hypothetical protein